MEDNKPIYNEVENRIKDIENRGSISGEGLENENTTLFQALCENSLTGVFILNDNKFQYINKAFYEIFGYKKDELIGFGPEKVVVPEDHEKLKENSRIRLSGEVNKSQYEIRGLCKNGDIRNIIVFGSIVNSDNDLLLVGNILDITDKIKAEEELLKSETRLFSAFQATGFGIYEQEGVLNQSEHTSFLDDKARYLLGIPKGEDNKWREYWEKRIHPDYYKAIMDSVFNFNFNGLDFDYSEYKYYNPELGEIWIRHIVNKVKRNEKGEIIDMVGVVQDITFEKNAKLELTSAKEKLEESETRLKIATKSGQLGIWDFNIKENFLIWDNKMCELYGISKDKLSNNFEAWVNRIHPDDKEKAINDVNYALNDNKDYNSIFRIIHPNGDIKYIQATGTVLKDEQGNHYRAIGTNKDVTEEINSKQELIEAKEKAEESDKLKSAFLKNMSHEVRTPLNSIIGFSELIAKPDNSVKDLEEYSSQIKENTERLITIIDDIIEISKIYTRQVNLKLSSFDFIQLIKDIAFQYDYKAKEKGIKLDLNLNIASDELILNSDKEKIEKILNHIIDNSIKFTCEGGVEINCNVNNKNLEISIADTGIGIPKNMQKIIFQPFRQVECGTTRKYGGNGLGLTLAKAYTGLLDGKITLESELNKGTKVIISLPIKD